MKVILADINKELTDEWQKVFKGVDGVEIYHGSIFDLTCDALVSPANSYGFMDGGLDLYISRFFGWDVEKRVQSAIKRNHHGELLVGQSLIVPTDHEKIPYCISAPTMRVPMILGRESVNAYLATRGVFLLIKHSTFEDGNPIADKVKSVAIPGMGTGVGNVPFDVCALQMRKAYDDIVKETYEFPPSWNDAMNRHQRLYSDTTRDLQFPD